MSLLRFDRRDYASLHRLVSSGFMGVLIESPGVLGARSSTQALGQFAAGTDVYFSADVETDGPIPGPFSMLSFALVYAGNFDGKVFHRPSKHDQSFYSELKPISAQFEIEALRVNGLNRDRLLEHGQSPEEAMTAAGQWVKRSAGLGQPVLVAYPLSFDWTWLYWYFLQFSREGSPFDYSKCYDIKTAFAVKAGIPIGEAGRSKIEGFLKSGHPHTHHAVDDAIEQAELFANIFEWKGGNGRVG